MFITTYIPILTYYDNLDWNPLLGLSRQYLDQDLNWRSCISYIIQRNLNVSSTVICIQK